MRCLGIHRLKEHRVYSTRLGRGAQPEFETKQLGRAHIYPLASAFCIPVLIMSCVVKQYKLGDSLRLNIDQDRIALLLGFVAKSLAIIVAVVWCAK
jgi:hypothetical protein